MTTSFKTFLIESDDPSSVLDKIVAECRPFVSELQKEDSALIWRGMPGSRNKPVEFPAPTNRKPRDSGEWFQLFFDMGIDLAFGIPNCRSTSIFTTGNIRQTDEYGWPVAVFPKGEFKYIWSPEINDSGVKLARLPQLVADEFAAEIVRRGIKVDVDTRYASIRMGSHKLSHKHGLDASTAIDSLTFSDVADFVGLETDQTSLSDAAKTKIQDAFISAMKSAFQSYYRNTDLHAAINAHNEILFWKTDGYWAVPQIWIEHHFGYKDEFKTALFAKIQN